MKKGRLIIWMVAALMMLASCNEEFLDTQPLDSVSSDATWADGALAQAFIYGVYSHLNYGGF